MFTCVLGDLAIIGMCLQLVRLAEQSSCPNTSSTHTHRQNSKTPGCPTRVGAPLTTFTCASRKTVLPRPFRTQANKCSEMAEWRVTVFFARYYNDDGILVQAMAFHDGRICPRVTQSLASDHFRLLDRAGRTILPWCRGEKSRGGMRARGSRVGSWTLTVCQTPCPRKDARSYALSWPRGHNLDRLIGERRLETSRAL